MRKMVSSALDVGRGLTDGNSLSLLHSWQNSALEIPTFHSHISPTLAHTDILQQSQRSRFNVHFAMMLRCGRNWKGNYFINLVT